MTRVVRALACLTLAASPGFAAQDAPTLAIDSLVAAELQKQHIPGASVAVVLDGKVLLSKGYGLANVEHDTPATDKTVFQLASVTKPFTAAAVMRLVEQGKLSLDDKISAHVNDLPEPWRDVTVRHLLSHTSGIKNYTSVPGFQLRVRQDFPKRDILALVSKDPLEFAPGDAWKYSNTGFFLLGMLIENISGQKYPKYLESEFFHPLGMSQTRVNDLRAVIPARAHGYAWSGRELRNAEQTSPTQPFSAGALVSSVDDLVKWDAALDAGKVVSKDSLGQMWSRAPLRDGKSADYGLGWGIADVNGHRVIAHGGGISGFSTQYTRFPDNRLTVIVLTNLEGGHADSIAQRIAGLVVPSLVPKHEEPITDDQPETTERLQRAFAGALKGVLDPEIFEAETRKTLEPRLKEHVDQHRAWGPIQSFQLLERKQTPDGLTRHRYRATLEHQKLQAFFRVNKEGKIQGLGIQLEF